MPITLDQARALDAIAREGTFARAATALHKGHTAVVYAAKTLEEQLGIALFDRSGYRTRLTPAGDRVLAACRRLLAADAEVLAVAHLLRTGWEARLRLVMDGVFPPEPIVRAVGSLTAARAPTRIEVFAEFLSGVESAFIEREADLMVSVLGPTALDLVAVALPRLRMHLVARRGHPLTRGKVKTGDLEEHVLVTVRGSDPRLALGTEGLAPATTVHLNDFSSKKAAILSGVGFGWLPEYLIAGELERGTLVRLRWGQASTTELHPHAYHARGRQPGRAAEEVLRALVSPSRRASSTRSRPSG